ALTANVLPASLMLKKTGSSTYALVNTGGASAGDFAAALRALIYLDPSARPRRGMRAVLLRAWGECGVLGSASAVLPIFPKPFAGADGDTLVCPDSPAFALRSLLGGYPEGGGTWLPATASPGLLDASRDAPGLYTYLLAPAGRCPGDTATAQVGIDAVPALPPDTVLCRGEALRLSVPPGLQQWAWTPGGTAPQVVATEAGHWLLEGSTGRCDFRDEVELGFFNCQPCEVYAPNVFAPTRYGLNESWQIFSPCVWERWSLWVYDRWGNLVFFSNDSEAVWAGFAAGREAPAGVYLWHLRAWSELRGQPRLYEAAGDVTLLR
ncbi:MAG TPA: gliding motility-associated C-terminal domain-containing protein, partial [Saprospiraceae bacterium]|nr:gliding motility-associated C-terminal domain-containing protein [Saprospiraceae bacterium]